jgi:mono/diheme cytochrome c family protein
VRAWLGGLAAALVLGVALGAWLTHPAAVDTARLDGLAGDPVQGERVFWAAGCASCHAAPGAEGEALLVLSGGHAIETGFGTFVAPNISPHPSAGIGGWEREEFARAVWAGVSPDGRHYYPAFPYTAYAGIAPQDLADLWSFMQALPESASRPEPSELAFPYSLRRGIGLWKRLHAGRGYVLDVPAGSELERGRYLAETLGHCGECHTPRTALGGLDRSRWMAGAPNPSGPGTIPGITPATLRWSAEDIAYYLESGFTPEFDSVGGTMASVVRSYARLPAEDRAAVAAYVKALPPAE